MWLETFSKVVNKNGALVPFKLNPQQRQLLDGLDKYNIVLKSRQLGVTTLSCGYSIYLTQNKPNTTCLLMSYSIDSATGIFEKLKQLYNDLPNAVKVPLVANNKKELKFTNGSRIIVATCGNKDVARGLTLAFAHLSEVAFMKDTVNKQILAIEQALTPSGRIILESTANGLNGFSEMWTKAERANSLYKPFFFSWLEDKLMFKDEYAQFNQRWKAQHGALPTPQELDEVETELYKQGASVEQLVWRRLKIANSDEEQFAQEFPANPIEAFISTGSNVFDSVKIVERLQYIDEAKPLLNPPTLPATLKPYLKKELTIWALPAGATRYYVGVDTGEGLGQDYSAIEIIDQNGAQVAEFKSNKIKPFVFAGIVNELGLYYNKALLVVEKASAGHSVVDKLRHDYGYMNMLKYKEYDARGKAKKKVGFVTNNKSKPLMIADYQELFETNQLLINSKDLLREMKLYTFTDGKMEAAAGGHDDLVMAMALALVGLKSGVNYV